MSKQHSVTSVAFMETNLRDKVMKVVMFRSHRVIERKIREREREMP